MPALNALFDHWRALLGRTWRDLASAGRSIARAAVGSLAWISLALRFVMHPATVFGPPAARRGLAVAGLVSLALGAALALVSAGPLHQGPAAAVDTSWTVAFAFVRLAILLLLLPGLPRTDVRHAWAAGLLPAFVGIIDPLRALAFVVSAWLTFGALLAIRVARRDAVTAVGWAWGSQILATALRWLVGGFLYVLAARH